MVRGAPLDPPAPIRPPAGELRGDDGWHEPPLLSITVFCRRSEQGAVEHSSPEVGDGVSARPTIQGLTPSSPTSGLPGSHGVRPKSFRYRWRIRLTEPSNAADPSFSRALSLRVAADRLPEGIRQQPLRLTPINEPAPSWEERPEDRLHDVFGIDPARQVLRALRHDERAQSLGVAQVQLRRSVVLPPPESAQERTIRDPFGRRCLVRGPRLLGLGNHDAGLPNRQESISARQPPTKSLVPPRRVPVLGMWLSQREAGEGEMIGRRAEATDSK
jgi:hypothetical protein